MKGYLGQVSRSRSPGSMVVYGLSALGLTYWCSCHICDRGIYKVGCFKAYAFFFYWMFVPNIMQKTSGSGGFRGEVHRPHVRPPAQSHAHFVGLFQSFETSPSLSKSVQRFKSYRLLKFSTRKPPEIPILALIFWNFPVVHPPCSGRWICHCHTFIEQLPGLEVGEELFLVWIKRLRWNNVFI